MKQYSRKAAAVFLCLLTLLFAFAPAGFATDSSGKCGDNVTWSFDTASETLTVSGTGAMYNYSGNDAPWKNAESLIWKNLSHIVIKDGITAVGDNAFSGCAYVKDVQIADSVVSIGTGAFSSCALGSVIIPEGVTALNMMTFAYCGSLTKIVLPATLTEIKSGAFVSCDKLTDVLFTGSEEQWNSVTVASQNSALSEAAITCNYIITAPAAFVCNEGSFPDSTVSKEIEQAYGEEIVTPSADPVRQGYTFSGWYPTPTLMDSKTGKTFTATWSINRHTVVFMLFDEVFEEEAVYDFGQEIDMPQEPYVEGYTFEGWSWSTADGDSVDEPSVMPDCDIIAEAVMEPVEYSLVFRVNGKAVSNKTVKFGSEISAPAEPSVKGYIFDGWGADVPETMPAENLTFDAVMIPVSYTVRLFDGAKLVGTIETDYEKSIELTAVAPLEKDGFVLAGWAKYDGGPVSYANGAKVSALADTDGSKVTLFAVWKRASSSAAVAIIGNPGSKTIKYGETLVLTAKVTDPDGDVAEIEWLVDGKSQGKGETFRCSGSGGTVTVRLKGSDGEPLLNGSEKEISDSESVTVKAGFFQKLISFFKNLFGANRDIIQK